MKSLILYAAERKASDARNPERLSKLKKILNEKGYLDAYVLGHDPREASTDAHGNSKAILIDARGLEEDTKCDVICLLVDLAVICKKQILLYDSIEDEEEFLDFSIDLDTLGIPREQQIIYKNFETAVSHVTLRLNRANKNKGTPDVG